jgi:hypothetical protein
MKQGRRRIRAFGLLVAGALLCILPAACDHFREEAGAQDVASSGEALPTVELTIKGERVKVEVARTREHRRRGLMHRKSLDEMAGMLFVWPEAAPRSFWMHDTLIPLSIAFIADDGTILQIEEMKALDEGHTYSRHAVRLALEMNCAWFALHGVKVGDRIAGLDKVGALPPADED